MKITPEMLRDLKACESQYRLFVELFPDGVEITEELCVKHAHDFDFEWASQNLLNSSRLGAYEEAIAPHRRAYSEAVALHWKAYEEAIAPHRRAYSEAVALHWKPREEAMARNFFRASQL